MDKLNDRLARLWFAAFGAGSLVILAMMAVTVSSPPFQGDLTRIGLLSERAFGPQAPSPAVEPRLLLAAPIDQADVLVIGDSFSATGTWQSVLARDGLRVATLTWHDLGEALCEGLAGRIERAGFKGRLLIVESVERLVVRRLNNGEGCAPGSSQGALPMHASERSQHAPTAPGALNWDAPLSQGLRVWWNTRAVLAGTGDVRAAHGVWVRRVTDGCERFSHRDCGQVTFLAEDDVQPAIAEADVARVRTASARLAPWPVLWVVVPNKTTVYVAPGRSAAFAARLAAEGLGPDLFQFAREARLTTRDLYRPNDTHLSTEGELRLGQHLLPAVRDRIITR